MSRVTKKVTMKKPYCKVCHDAGKPESEYTSHWVKDLSGKTTCPTLLNLECRYCFKPGHTVKFCDVLIKMNKEKEREDRKSATASKQTKTLGKNQPQSVRKNVNGFAVLYDDSDTEEQVSNNIVVNEYESFCDSEPVKKTAELTGWAAIAAKPKVVQEVNQNTGMIFLTKTKPVNKPVQEPVKESVITPKPAVLTKRWADLSDSEDDDYYYRSQTSLAKEQIDDEDDW